MNLKVDYITKADGWNNGKLTPKGVMVHSTATPGVMAQQFRDRWNRPNVGASVHAFVDDKEVIQCLPWDKKAGHCGASANNTHIAFEICEPAGFKYQGNKMVGYDVKTQQTYFSAVWRNAVELTAYLCKEYNLDPLKDGVVICHSEGYERGIASNHADVMHWFPKHNKDMDDFRKDVKAKMAENTTKPAETEGPYNTIDEVPEWGKATVEKLLNKDFLLGTEAGLDISYDMLRILVINDRAGLYD